MKTLRDNILLLLGLPTPDETQAWKDKAEEMASKHDALQRLMAERYESEWKVTKDGTRRYRKVATKVLVNAWVTESEPIDFHGEYMRKMELEENGIQVD